MFGELPSGILSQNGYMGCLAGLEVSGKIRVLFKIRRNYILTQQAVEIKEHQIFRSKLMTFAMFQVGGAQGVSPHPLADAVVPSTEVTSGCQGENTGLSLGCYW